MPLWQYPLLFILVLLGGLVAFRFGDRREPVGLLLSFSGAYILGITVLHLMPSVFYDGSHIPGMWVMGGFFLQLLLEQLSAGVEHGHIHSHKNASKQFAIPIMIGLCLHALLEGLPLGSYENLHAHGHQHTHGEGHLFWGIMLHKIPAAFALSAVLQESGYSRRFTISMLVIFATMSPLGAALSESFVLNPIWQERILAVVVGSFLHISTTILFESDSTSHHHVSWKKLVIIVIGIGLALLTIL